MNLKKISLTIFISLCVLCVAQGMYYYPKMPEKVASHFGLFGQADTWSTKFFFIIFYYMTIGIMTVLFLGISFAASKIPVDFINLPNKDYWLSQENKQKTFEFMFPYFLWFACATLLLLLDLFHQIFAVHLGETDVMTHHFLSLGVYIGFCILWCTGLYIRFPKNKS